MENLFNQRKNITILTEPKMVRYCENWNADLTIPNAAFIQSDDATVSDVFGTFTEKQIKHLELKYDGRRLGTAWKTFIDNYTGQKEPTNSLELE